MKKLNIKKTKTKKETLNDNKRNYFNCFSYNYNCFTNISRSVNCNANRREWNINTSTKSKE